MAAMTTAFAPSPVDVIRGALRWLAEAGASLEEHDCCDVAACARYDTFQRARADLRSVADELDALSAVESAAPRGANPDVRRAGSERENARGMAAVSTVGESGRSAP